MLTFGSLIGKSLVSMLTFGESLVGRSLASRSSACSRLVSRWWVACGGDEYMMLVVTHFIPCGDEHMVLVLAYLILCSGECIGMSGLIHPLTCPMV